MKQSANKFVPKRLIVSVVVAVVTVALAVFTMKWYHRDSARIAARRLETVATKRMAVLENYMAEALATNPSEWPELKGLPDDMVIYRYVSDTLQSWSNQFTLDNDDISSRIYVQRITNLRYNIESPLFQADTSLKYINIGQKWYLITSISNNSGSKVIGGLEIKNNLDPSYNGINKELGVSDRFSIYPITEVGGEPVNVEGIPLFKLIRENRGYITTLSDLFSPNVYAGGNIFYTLGSILIINILLFAIILIAFLNKRGIHRRVFLKPKKGKPALYFIILLLALVGICLHIHLTFRSIIVNSNITLEIYRVTGISRLTIYIYLTYLLLMFTIPMLLQMMSPVLRRWLGIRYNSFSRRQRFIFATIFSFYIVAITSTLGFKREEDRVEIWANRLAIDRDLGFEMKLKDAEIQIANDPTIYKLINIVSDYRIILNRLTENYLQRVSQDYEINISITKDASSSLESDIFFENRLRNAVPISQGSHFLYSRTGKGKPQYTGVFFYYYPDGRISRLMLAFDLKTDRENLGANQGRYSYGKYIDDKLVSFKGDYPYPTILSGRLKKIKEGESSSHIVADKNLHFVNNISDDECIIISRPSLPYTRYLVPWLLILAISFFCLSLPLGQQYVTQTFEKNYYKSRINSVLFLSLSLTLVAMATVSVFFVYRRNESAALTLMSGKISTIQSLLEASVRYYENTADLDNRSVADVLEKIAVNTKSKITLYTPGGKVLKSTYPEIYERMEIGSRINEEAYRNIIYQHKSFYIHKEKVSTTTCYAMYAPIFNDQGEMIAIVGSPYTDEGLNLKTEIAFYIISILTMFFMLLLIMRILTTREVNKMFRPLLNMGRKMNAARVDGLEYIIYDRDDEIASLVKAYNFMVHDLSENSKLSAQVERDKAWSEMARQVAHEIKNPLTPIKLQIQRIIRLKAKNSPDWEEKFDAIVPVIMDSINELTDTANEFSTFAKLYSEEPVRINLDKLIKDEVSLFDDKENITLTYYDLQDAEIIGPKPQLTRVIVNLLTNAIQAIENEQAEVKAQGGEAKEGKIIVSLRLSSKEGYYDIVFEDNGPGVKDENRNKLFTPNFTTKTGGTGLGLAICKNILERCGGEISYSKSFSLQGACFTIRFPQIPSTSA